jgi:hypothetical protein
VVEGLDIDLVVEIVAEVVLLADPFVHVVVPFVVVVPCQLVVPSMEDPVDMVVVPSLVVA